MFSDDSESEAKSPVRTGSQGGSGSDLDMGGSAEAPSKQQLCLVTAAMVVCALRLRFSPNGYDSGASDGTLAALHPHEHARRGVALPLTEDVKRVLDKLMDKAQAGQLSDEYEWVRLRVPVKL